MGSAQKVRDVMTSDPPTVQSDETVVEAARLMKEKDVGPVIVMSDGTFQGILTDRDIAIRVVAEGRDPNGVRVEEVASTEVQTISPDEPADEAVRRMRDNAIRRLLVIEGERPVGIVSLGDLAIRKDPSSALADISNAPPNN